MSRSRVRGALSKWPVEVVGAAGFAVAALYADGSWRWAFIVATAVFLVLLLRTDAGLRLDLAILAAGLLATAVFWEEIGSWRLAFVAAGILTVLIAHRLGAIVWPDVAIIFLVGLAVVAVRDARMHERPLPDPALLAVVELPGERIRPPSTDLDAPAEVDVIALTPAESGDAEVVVHESERFEGLLLDDVDDTSPARDEVPVLVERGADDVALEGLARATLDATELVLVPSGHCFVSEPQRGLQRDEAARLMTAYGLEPAEAKSFAESFTGTIDYVPVRSGSRFRRYYAGAKTKVGRFLTRTRFSTRDDAREGLELPPANTARYEQTVSAIAPTMTLTGRIKGGLEGARQFVVLRRACFEYGDGEAVPE